MKMLGTGMLGFGKIERVIWSLDGCSFIRVRGTLWPAPTWYRKTKPKRGRYRPRGR